MAALIIKVPVSLSSLRPSILLLQKSRIPNVTSDQSITPVKTTATFVILRESRIRCDPRRRAHRGMNARNTPMERNKDSIAGKVRGSLGGLIAGPGLIKLTLLGIATKAAARWIKNASSTEVSYGAAGPPSLAGQRFNRWARVQVINT
jgi:hypothetical protein